jgi:glyoxylase-like metal-dependent hydrolase (beta-lactamase superfamily II)
MTKEDCPKTPVNFVFLKEGQILNYGDFSLKIIDVPGHTPGQIVLWDENKSLLISADHILDEITPNISFWGFKYGDSLGTYIESLHKIRALNSRVALPSHRRLIYSVNERIDALIAHHEERLGEVL